MDWIFYKQCFICGKKIGKMTSFACENCSNILKYELCEYSVVHTLDKYFDELYSMFAYRKIIRKTIIDFKFNNKPYLGYLFASFIVEFLLVHKVRADVIIPVPIHYKRYKERGYNQSEILARFVGKKMNVDINTNVLRKNRHSAKQSTLTARERIENVTNSFSVSNRKKILGKTIILIDDIYTTGATANECSKILKENGALKVIVATIAHGKF